MSANVVIQNTRPSVVIDQATVPVLLTTISKGIKGAKGDKGDQGDVGPAGTTDHLLLTHIGTNTHDLIDTALTRLANTSGVNTGDQDLTGLVHANRTALDVVSGVNTGDQDLSALATNTSLNTHINKTTDAHGGIVSSSDSRLTDSRVPTTHASTHLSDGSDPTNMHVYHGVESRTTISPLPTNLTTTTFTLACATTPMTYYMGGIKVVVSTNKTTTLSGAAGLYYIYWDDAAGTLTNSTTFPGLYPASTNVLIATVWWNGSDYGVINDERHSYDRDQAWHTWAHRSVGTRWSSGIDLLTLTGTGASATMTLSAGEILDEDIQFTISASSSFATPNAYRLIYQTGATTYSFVNGLSTVPFYKGANNRPNVVNSTGYALTELSSAVNRYANYFVYATTDNLCPIYIATETLTNAMVGQNGYTSLANARAASWPSLTGVALSAEMKPLYRVIVRADGVVQAFTSADDYRSVSSLPQSAGTSSTTASSVSFAPAGNIASTNVQTALEELDVEKIALAGSAVSLSSATGDQVAYTLDYTTNKATSGNDTGLLIKMTDTASPGTSYPLEIRTGVAGATTVAYIKNDGMVNANAYQGGSIFRTATSSLSLQDSGWTGNTTGTGALEHVTVPINNQRASGQQSVFAIKPTYAQGTGSTATNTDLLINRTETSVGTGTVQLLADFQVGGTSKFKVDNTGIATSSNSYILAGAGYIQSVGRYRIFGISGGGVSFRNDNNTADTSILIAGISKAIVSKSTNYTATATDHTILVTADATITLPAAASNSGRVYVIKKTYAAGTGVVIDGNASEQVDGALTQTISAQYGILRIQSDGTNWWVI